MPIKWPWSRSRPTAEEQPSAPAGPAAPVDPGWRAVPPVQRTIGAMELTAPPRSFTESLATAQDPALISENRPAVLTTGSPVSVLRTVQQPDSVAAQQPTSSPGAVLVAPMDAAVERATGITGRRRDVTSAHPSVDVERCDRAVRRQ